MLKGLKRLFHVGDAKSSGVRPRVIIDMDFGNQTITCTRGSPTKELYAISHRFQTRQDNPNWTVYCDSEAPYMCELTDEEATNLYNYLREISPKLWVDYVCINQTSEDDKCAQVSIMGGIYSRAVSLVVGPALQPTTPPEDYLIRAWCIQERMFGRVHFPWDFERCSESFLVDFAENVITRIPLVSTLKIKERYSRTEDWREAKLQEAEGLYPAASHLIREVTDMMVQGQRDRKRMAIVTLQIRMAINCDFDIETVTWACQMFDVECFLGKDRLYGVWGVPTYLKGVHLPYEDPEAAMAYVRSVYPLADFAFYTTLKNPRKSLAGHFIFRNVDEIQAVIVNGGNEEPPTEAIEILEWKRVSLNPEILVVRGEECTGFGWHRDPHCAVEAVPIMFVVHNDILMPPHHEAMTPAFDLFRDRIMALGATDAGWGLPFGVKHEAMKMLGVRNPQN